MFFLRYQPSHSAGVEGTTATPALSALQRGPSSPTRVKAANAEGESAALVSGGVPVAVVIATQDRFARPRWGAEFALLPSLVSMGGWMDG